MTYNLQPAYKGQAFVRLAIATALGGDDSEQAANIAKARWGEDSIPHQVLKSTGGLGMLIQQKAEIAAGATVADNWARPLANFEGAAAEFFSLVRERSLIGRMAGLRRVPLRTRMVSIATGFSGAWVGEGKAKPVGKAAFAQGTLPRRQVASLCVFTDEHLRAADPASELLIRDDLARALIDVIDASFIDPANSGTTDIEPASIAYGAPVDAVTGTSDADDIRAAVAYAIANFDGDLEQAVLIARPEFLAFFGLNPLLNTEAIGARGGSIGGIPALPSKALPLDGSGKQQMVLVDPTGIALGEEGLELRTSREASIEMLDSNLTGDSIGVVPGTAASTVSLWSTNSVGLLAEKHLNFAVARAGSVRVITGLEGGVAS